MDQAPTDTELRNIIDKLAQFVARNGPEFEQMTKNKQRDNPKFSFLFGGEYFNYYQYKVTTEQAILKQKGINPIQNADQRLNVSQQQQSSGHGILGGAGAQPSMHNNINSQAPPLIQNNGLNSVSVNSQVPPPIHNSSSMQLVGQANMGAPLVTTNAVNQGVGSASWLQNELANLQLQQTTLQDQVRQSEQNLAAQHAALMVQQQGRVEDAVKHAQEENLQSNAQSTNTDLAAFDVVLQPIIDSCTKDSISAGKAWILQHSLTAESNQVVAEHLLKKVIQETTFNHKLHIIYLVNDVLHHCARKKSVDLRKAMESVVVPMFCNTSLAASEEQLAKLNKLLSLWESKNNYFEEGIVEKLKTPKESWTDYQANLMTQHASAISSITSTTKQTFDNYQSQHQAFVNHALKQIQNIEQQKTAIDRQLNVPVPVPTPAPLQNAPTHSGPPPNSGCVSQSQNQMLNQSQNQLQHSGLPPRGPHDGPAPSMQHSGPPPHNLPPHSGPPPHGMPPHSALPPQHGSHSHQGPPPHGGPPHGGAPHGGPSHSGPLHGGLPRGGPPHGPPHSSPPHGGMPHSEYSHSEYSRHDYHSDYSNDYSDFRQTDYAHGDYQHRSDYASHSDYSSDYRQSDYARPDYSHSNYPPSDYESDYSRSDYGRSDYGPPEFTRRDRGPPSPHRSGPFGGPPPSHGPHGGPSLGGPHHGPPLHGGPPHHSGPPPLMATQVPPPNLSGPLHGGLASAANDINFSQPPPGWSGQNSENRPFSNVPLPDFSKPPPGFGPPPPLIHEPSPEDLMPSMPYYELPAGLMVPLVKLEDGEYKPLDPEAIRLPPPAPPNERLLAAVEAFYAPPNHDSPRDSDGWEKLGLYEYFKAKNAAKKKKEDDIASGIRQKSKSPSPILRPRSKSPSPPKKRYRSKSRSKSKSRSPRARSRSKSPVHHNVNHRRNNRNSNHNSRNRRRRNSGKDRSPRVDRSDRSPTPPSFLGSTYGKAHEMGLDESNKGHQLLRKMGWGGAGLGANEQGIEAPISGGEVRDRSDMYKGVGISLNDPYENFRKSKGQAFITRMKARAEERAEDRVGDRD